jgi:hypothetical protein
MPVSRTCYSDNFIIICAVTRLFTVFRICLMICAETAPAHMRDAFEHRAAAAGCRLDINHPIISPRFVAGLRGSNRALAGAGAPGTGGGSGRRGANVKRTLTRRIKCANPNIQAASSSCAWRTLVLLADCDWRGCEPTATAGIPTRPFGWSGHGDGTLEPLSAICLATASGRSAEFGTAPGPQGSDRPTSVAVQGELDVG